MRSRHNVEFDPFSVADNIQMLMAVGLEEVRGPYVTGDLKWGREDAKAEDVESFGRAPQPTDSTSEYIDAFKTRGFTDQEMVALSYIHAFGNVHHPNQRVRSDFPTFDSYWLQQVAKGNHT